MLISKTKKTITDWFLYTPSNFVCQWWYTTRFTKPLMTSLCKTSTDMSGNILHHKLVNNAQLPSMHCHYIDNLYPWLTFRILTGFPIRDIKRSLKLFKKKYKLEVHVPNDSWFSKNKIGIRRDQSATPSDSDLDDSTLKPFKLQN